MPRYGRSSPAHCEHCTQAREEQRALISPLSPVIPLPPPKMDLLDQIDCAFDPALYNTGTVLYYLLVLVKSVSFLYNLILPSVIAYTPQCLYSNALCRGVGSVGQYWEHFTCYICNETKVVAMELPTHPNGLCL